MASKSTCDDAIILEMLLANSEDEFEDDSEDEFLPQDADHELSDSSSDESDEHLDSLDPTLPISAGKFKAKDGTIWEPIDDQLPTITSQTSGPNIIKAQPGPTPFARRQATSPFAALKLFLSHNIMLLINNYTRIEAQRVFPMTNCTLNIDEIWKFIGLMYARGVFAAKNIPLSELWNKKKGNPIFRNTMPRDRFKYILRLLRFDNKQDRRQRILMQKDRFAHISEVWKIFVENCVKHYNPGPYICVDEQLFPSRARCPFTQYISSKPDKFGIKFWLLADVDSKYMLNAAPYTGADETRPANVQMGEHIVWNLTKPFHNKGYNVTCDNFFTSISLAKRLLSANTTILGTTRSNRREIPDEARTLAVRKDKPIYSSMFLKDTSSPITLTTYKCKKSKSVHMMSSMHMGNINCDNTPKRKPDTVIDYNRTKFGVDILDSMARLYSVKPGCRRWPFHVFCNILDIAAINAWVIFKRSNQSNITRRQFLFDLIDELTDTVNDLENTGLDASSSSVIRKTCQIRSSCKSNKAQTTCVRCKKFTCGSCTKEKIIQVICKKCN